MLKGFLGAASGSALYLYSHTASVTEDQKAGLYLTGMLILAMTLTGLVRASARRFKASFRTLSYLARSRVVVMSDRASRAQG